jgi:hypothetical protein
MAKSLDNSRIKPVPTKSVEKGIKSVKSWRYHGLLTPNVIASQALPRLRLAPSPRWNEENRDGGAFYERMDA